MTSRASRSSAGEIVDRHIGAFAGIGDGGGAAHAGIAAGDQRLAALEPAGTLVAGLAMVGRRLHFAGQARPGLLLLLERRLGIFVERIFKVGHEILSRFVALGI